eukprot:353696-Chlamydomonas_euryale.AAC.5
MQCVHVLSMQCVHAACPYSACMHCAHAVCPCSESMQRLHAVWETWWRAWQSPRLVVIFSGSAQDSLLHAEVACCGLKCSH